MFSADQPDDMAGFLQHFHAAVARLVNFRWGRYGPVWSSRATVTPALADQKAQLQGLRYLLAQPVKAGIARHPRDWHGPSSTEWLLEGTPLTGERVDQTAYTLAGRNGKDPGDRKDYCSSLQLQLSPLPCFAGMAEDEWRQVVRDLADSIAESGPTTPPTAPSAEEQLAAAAARADEDGTVPSELPQQAAGVPKSKRPERRKKRLVHASCEADEEAFLAELKLVQAAHAAAAELLRTEVARAQSGLPARAVQFPDWTFPAAAPARPLRAALIEKAMTVRG
ncbi:MAG: hypothetical protein HY902_16585 [Deltaproteobacteria bacterium]|nr:hypothetical protein [Deltaproteobacteria bacterium]